MRYESYSPSTCSLGSTRSGYEHEIPLTLSPTQLLSLAIKKRRMLYEDKQHDFRRVLGSTSMISSLCKYLGEGRAKRRSRRNGRSRRRGQFLKHQWQQDEFTSTESAVGDGGNSASYEPAPQIVPCNNQNSIHTDNLPEEAVPSVCKRLKVEREVCRRQENDRKLVEEDSFNDLFANFDAASYEQSLETAGNGPEAAQYHLSFSNDNYQYMIDCLIDW